MEYVPAKTIVTRTKDPNWFGLDYNMNIYRGCCHGCIYCDSRSECYRIDQFDRVRAKENALQTIRNDLRRKVRSGIVGTGAMSDPYNPFEEELQLTRHALELLSAYGFGSAIATKSDLILRDLDILKEIQEQSPVLIKMTITTSDDKLCKQIEPGVCPSSQRFAALQTIAQNGIFCGILLMPVLPFLEDNEENVLSIVRLAQESGVRFIYPAFGMTLRQNQRDWYYQKLDEQFPGQNLKERYMKQYGDRYRCTSPRAAALYHKFAHACDRAGILYRMRDIISAYKQGYANSQLTFF